MKYCENENKHYYKLVWLIAGFLLLVRMFAMYYVPLNDSTEARYAEIARIMLETRDFITPMHHYGEPFWAKPPLSTWGSAFSMQLMGVSAFAARLPGLLLSLGILGIVFNLVRSQYNIRVAINAVMVLASSFYFFLDAGTVMTDPSLLFCTTLGIAAFWHAVIRKKLFWGYMFFLSLSLGLLAKGPVAVILVLMPLTVWTIWNKQYAAVWQRMPWFFGSLLTLFIALPWYILAELKTPGFIYYFIVGEHIQRFLEPGWSGDKYGFAHVAPYGMIWVYAVIGTLPWSPLIMRHIFSLKNNINQDCWLNYLLACTFVPLVFFTFARNIIYPYVFPSLPTFAILFVILMEKRLPLERYILRLAPLCGVIFLILTLLFIIKPELVEKSQKRVVAACQNTDANNIIYWAPKAEYSAYFYSKGHIIATIDPTKLHQFSHNCVVVDATAPYVLPNIVNLTQIATIHVLKNVYNVFKYKG